MAKTQKRASRVSGSRTRKKNSGVEIILGKFGTTLLLFIFFNQLHPSTATFHEGEKASTSEGEGASSENLEQQLCSYSFFRLDD